MDSTPEDIVRSRRKGQPLDPGSRALFAGRQHRKWSSRQLHRLGVMASHAWAGCVVFALALGWVGWGAASGFRSYWSIVLESDSVASGMESCWSLCGLLSREIVEAIEGLNSVLDTGVMQGEDREGQIMRRNAFIWSQCQKLQVEMSVVSMFL